MAWQNSTKTEHGYGLLTISVNVAAGNLDKPNLWFWVSRIHSDKPLVLTKKSVIDTAFGLRTHAIKAHVVNPRCPQ